MHLLIDIWVAFYLLAIVENATMNMSMQIAFDSP